ncbi:MAG: WD40/YVTN/BNR-like repeat-containing protein, partial [Pyrinomonadaceae bacterium]
MRSSFVLICLSLVLSSLSMAQRAPRAGAPPVATPTNATATPSPAGSPAATATPTPVPTPSPTPDAMGSQVFSGLRFRSIGPAVTSGRVIAFAVDPNDRSKYYVAVASGGVWKTVNSGTTFTPVFDGEGAFSIGAIALDPKNPATVWVGTGERNSQRSVAYGDGVYRSDDGGRSWRNMGLKTSEHIGRIAIDPRDSNVVFVAAQGPLWAPGGERGLYKTTDGGKTWKQVISISENTG